MRAIRLPAFAKINWCLDILGRRPDGYHELRTIFQTISLHDTLRFLPARVPEIELVIQGDAVLERQPVERNLVYRAVEAIRRDQKIRSGVRIDLEKRIPAGRGLGGGSRAAGGRAPRGRRVRGGVNRPALSAGRPRRQYRRRLGAG